MTAGYARLCLPYVGAVCVRRGTVGLDDFTAAALEDTDTLRMARRLTVIEDDNPDPNALLPQRVEIDLAEGRTVAAADVVRRIAEGQWQPRFQGLVSQAKARMN